MGNTTSNLRKSPHTTPKLTIYTHIVMKNTSPLISVIMPVYNSELYLAEAIESILNQSFRDFEFIILDDGSSDRSLEISKAYAAKDKRVILLPYAHQGLTPLLNLGLKKAKGKYIARMDSDDIAAPDRFQKQIDFLETHPKYVAVGSNTILIDIDGDPIGNILLPENHNAIDLAQINGKGMIVHPTVMIRKLALEKINNYHPEFESGEDFDLFLRLAEVGKLANLPQKLLQYRLHFNNVTTTRKIKCQRAKQAALKEAYQRRKINKAVPKIAINSQTNHLAENHFFWMRCSLESGFFKSARKHAKLGWKLSKFNFANLKKYLIGMSGALGLKAIQLYQSFRYGTNY